jgi:uncharacterized membrane protein YhaH (DUF805 family)
MATEGGLDFDLRCDCSAFGARPMLLADFWRGRTGRVAYSIALIISSVGIASLPFITAKISITYAGGMDPALSVVRMLLWPLIIGIGLTIMGGPLVFFARRRMREIGLSGAWLIIFPLAPLGSLSAFAHGAVALWPPQFNSPVTTLSFWAEMAFGALLAVIPAGDYLSRGGSRAIELVREATICEGRLRRRPFVLRVVAALSLMLVLSVFDLFVRSIGFPRPGEHSFLIYAAVAAMLSTVASLSLSIFLAASTVRRLHDLNLGGAWLALFPLGLPGLGQILLVLYNPRMLAYTFSVHAPVQLLTNLLAIGCLILGSMLIFKRGGRSNNSYDSSDTLSSA